MNELENFDVENVDISPKDRAPRKPVDYKRQDSQDSNTRVNAQRAVVVSNRTISPLINARSGSLAQRKPAPRIRNPTESLSSSESNDTAVSKTLTNQTSSSMYSKNPLTATISLGLIASTTYPSRRKESSNTSNNDEFFQPKRMNGSTTSSFADPTDNATMQLMVQEALFDTTTCKPLTSTKLEQKKTEFKQLSTQINSLQNRLVLENRIKEAAVNLLRTTPSPKSQEQIAQSNRKVESISTELLMAVGRLLEIERSIQQHYCAVLNWEVISRQRQDKTVRTPLQSNDTKVREQEQLINVLTSKISKLEQSYEKSMQELSASQDEAIVCRAERDAFEKKAKKLEEELQLVKKSTKPSRGDQPTAAEFNRLKLELATTRADLSSIKENFDASRDNVAQLQLHLEEDQTLLESKDRMISNLLTELEEATTKLDIKKAAEERTIEENISGPEEKIIASLKRQIELLEKDLADLRRNPTTKNTVPENRERVRNVLGTQLKEAVLERERLKMELQQESNRARSVEDQLENLKSTLPRSFRNKSRSPVFDQVASEGSDTETEDEAAFNRYQHEPSFKKSSNEAVHKPDSPYVKSVQRSSGDDIKRLEETVSDLQKSLEEVESNLVSLYREIDSTASFRMKFDFFQFTSAVRDLIQTKERLEMEVERSRAKPQSKVGSPKSNDKELIDEIATLEKELSSLTALYDEASREIKLFKRKQEQLELDLQDTRQQKESSQKELERVIQKCRQTELSLANQSQELVTIKIEKDGLFEQVEELKDALDKLYQEKSRVERNIKEKLLESEQKYQKEIQNVQKMHHEQVSQFSNSSRDRRHELDRQTAQYEDEIQRLKAGHRSELKTLNDLHQSEIDGLQQKISRQEKSIRELKEELEHHDKSSNALEALKSDNRQLERMLDAKVREVSLLEQKMERLQSDLNLMNKKLENQQALEQELNELKQSEKRIQSQYEEQLQHMQAQLIQFTTERVKLLESIDNYQHKQENEQIQKQRVESDMQRLQDEIQRHSKEQQAQQLKYKEEASRMLSLNQSLKKEIEDLQQKIQLQSLQGLDKVQIAIFSGRDDALMKKEFKNMVDSLKQEYEKQVQQEIQWRKVAEKEVSRLKGIDFPETPPPTTGKFFGLFG